MKVTHNKTFTQTVDEIGATYLDADFIIAKNKACGSRNTSVDIQVEGDDQFVVTINREVPSEVPNALKSFVKPWNSITTKEQWSGPDGGPYIGTIDVTTHGVPMNMSSVITVTENGEGSAVEIVTDISCSIPLVGKKLADFAAKAALKDLDSEADFIGENA